MSICSKHRMIKLFVNSQTANKLGKMHTVLPGLTDHWDEWPPVIYNHFSIHRPLFHAIWLVTNDLLADTTNNCQIAPKTPLFACYKWPQTDKSDHKTKSDKRDGRWSKTKEYINWIMTMPWWFKWLLNGKLLWNWGILNDRVKVLLLFWDCKTVN